MRSFSAAVISFVFVSSVQAIKKASTGSNSYIEDVSYSSSNSSGYAGHNSSGFGGVNAFKKGNFGTHNSAFKDYKNDSTIQKGELDEHGVLNVDTFHNSIRETLAPTTSYGTGTGYHNPGYSYQTPHFPQELHSAGGKGASLPYAQVSGYDYNNQGGQTSWSNPSSSYGAYGNQHAQYNTGYNSGYGNTYGGQQGGSYGGYATYNPGNNYQHSYGATQYSAYGQPSYSQPSYYGGYGSYGSTPLAAPVYGGYGAAPYVAPTPQPSYYGVSNYGAPSYGGFGGFNSNMAGSGFVHGSIGNEPLSMSPPAVGAGLTCHGKKNASLHGAFLGAGLDDNSHTGCTLEDEVQAYAMDDDPWAAPKKTAPVVKSPAVTIQKVAVPEITQPLVADKLTSNNPAAALDFPEQSSGDNGYADMRLDDPYALPMRHTTRRTSLPELDNSTDASFAHHGMFW